MNREETEALAKSLLTMLYNAAQSRQLRSGETPGTERYSGTEETDRIISVMAASAERNGTERSFPEVGKTEAGSISPRCTPEEAGGSPARLDISEERAGSLRDSVGMAEVTERANASDLAELLDLRFRRDSRRYDRSFAEEL